MATGEFNAGGSPEMDCHPVKGEGKILFLIASWERTGDSAGKKGHLLPKRLITYLARQVCLCYILVQVPSASTSFAGPFAGKRPWERGYLCALAFQSESPTFLVSPPSKHTQKRIQRCNSKTKLPR